MKFFLSREEREQRMNRRRESQTRVADLIVTTADLKDPYTILGVLQADSLILLKERAVQTGADAIVGVGFAGYDMQCYGTAVSIKKRREALDLDEVVNEMVARPMAGMVETSEVIPLPLSERDMSGRGGESPVDRSEETTPAENGTTLSGPQDRVPSSSGE